MSQQRQIQLTAQQMAALVLVESRMEASKIDIALMSQLGALSLANAVMEAALVLEKAHGAFLAETQKLIKVASSAEMPRLVST